MNHEREKRIRLPVRNEIILHGLFLRNELGVLRIRLLESKILYISSKNMFELILIIFFSITTCIYMYKAYRHKLKAVFNWGKMRDFYNALNEDEIIHVHTDRFGNKWYTWQNPIQITPERALLAELAASQLDMNVTRDSMKKWVERMRQHGNKGDITKLFGELEVLSDRLDWVCEEKCLEELSLVYIILEGENFRAPSQKDTDRKKKIFKEDAETRSFFLRCAWKNTKIYSHISELDILPYLAQKRKESQARKSSILN